MNDQGSSDIVKTPLDIWNYLKTPGFKFPDRKTSALKCIRYATFVENDAEA